MNIIEFDDIVLMFCVEYDYAVTTAGIRCDDTEMMLEELYEYIGGRNLDPAILYIHVEPAETEGYVYLSCCNKTIENYLKNFCIQRGYIQNGAGVICDSIVDFLAEFGEFLDKHGAEDKQLELSNPAVTLIDDKILVSFPYILHERKHHL